MNTKEAIRNLGKVKFDGSNIAQGKAYHGFDGLETGNYTGSVMQRINLILDNFNVNDKHGIDLGCSVGGISIELARRGAIMYGYDYDHQAVKVGRAYAEKESLNARFNTLNITLEEIEKLGKEPFGSDFCVWFSHWMWFLKQHGIEDALNALWHLGKSIPVLFFETSLGDGMAGKAVSSHGIDENRMKQILEHCYKSVKKIGVDEQWRKRPIFMCSGCLPCQYKGHKDNTILRTGYNVIEKKQPSAYGFNQYEKERDALLKLLNIRMTKHFPLLIKYSSDRIVTDYCGEDLKKLPANWKDQAEEILQVLKEANIVHRDIIPRNLLIKDGIIKLIDFSWAGSPGKDASKFPGRLGTDFRKYPDFDDRYSLYKSLEWIGEHEQ